jgi:hypothetical protein
MLIRFSYDKIAPIQTKDALGEHRAFVNLFALEN